MPRGLIGPAIREGFQVHVHRGGIMCYKCYMEAAPRRRKKNHVGIRELRQNLSVYLKRVEAGETLEVADRGRIVALLSPLPEPASVIEQLIAEGRATTPVGDLLDLGLPEGKVKCAGRRGHVRRAPP